MIPDWNSNNYLEKYLWNCKQVQFTMLIKLNLINVNKDGAKHIYQEIWSEGDHIMLIKPFNKREL